MGWVNLDVGKVVPHEDLKEIGKQTLARDLALAHHDCNLPRHDRGDQDFIGAIFDQEASTLAQST